MSDIGRFGEEMKKKQQVNEDQVLEIIVTGFVVVQDNDESTGKEEEARIQKEDEEEDVKIQEEDEKNVKIQKEDDDESTDKD
jgi:hypothetical protein